MKIRNEGYTHFRDLEVVGGIDTSGNGVRISSSAASANPVIEVVGDDTNAGLTIKGKGTGTVDLMANGLSRFIANPVTKTIVDGSATSLFEVACAAAAIVGGTFSFLVSATDGTDHQAISGTVAYSAVNKAGTHTCTITQQTGEAKAVSSGTLTLAFTHVTGTNKTVVKLQPTGSLTETGYTIMYTVQPLVGAVTIL